MRWPPDVDIRPTPRRVVLGTLLAMLPLAWLIGAASGHRWWQSLAWPDGLLGWSGVLLALAVGGAVAFAAHHAELRLAGASFDWVVKPLAAIKLDHPTIIAISLAAGVCEEILFRAALQPLLGIGWATLLFALLHFQYALFAPRLWQAGAYFVVIYLVGFALGLVYEAWGLWVAMAVHAGYDYVGLRLLAPQIARARAQLLARVAATE